MTALVVLFGAALCVLSGWLGHHGSDLPSDGRDWGQW